MRLHAAFIGILVFCLSSLFAQRSLTYGDWTVMLSDDGKDLVAGTGQDADKLLGYRCFTSASKCAHIIIPATACEDGQRYPMLINASGGSLMVECLCSKNGTSYELLPLDWDGFHRTILESTGYIGFAIPLASGQFKVVRFSLRGAKEAIEAAETAIKNKDTAEYH